MLEDNLQVQHWITKMIIMDWLIPKLVVSVHGLSFSLVTQIIWWGFEWNDPLFVSGLLFGFVHWCPYWIDLSLKKPTKKAVCSRGSNYFCYMMHSPNCICKEFNLSSQFCWRFVIACPKKKMVINFLWVHSTNKR